MKVDSHIFTDYLEDTYDVDHWVFHRNEGTGNSYIYTQPEKHMKREYLNIYNSFKKVFEDFHIWNKNYVEQLFPNYLETMDKVNILISIGAPDNRDACFIYHNSEPYMVFDIRNFYRYKDLNIEKIIEQIVTHELIHSFIHEDYSEVKDEDTYENRINYTIFDEGLAHLIAYSEDIKSYDLKYYQKYYDKSLIRLKNLLEEEDNKNKEQEFYAGQIGPYWDKYLCIIGKFYFFNHLDTIVEVYQKGYNGIIEKVLKKSFNQSITNEYS